MIKTFEDVQKLNQENFDAFVASCTALTKSCQSLAQEFTEYSKKHADKTAAVFKDAAAAKSFEQALELQQAYAKDAYESALAEISKVNDMIQAAAKSSMKPYEATLANMGVKMPDLTKK